MLTNTQQVTGADAVTQGLLNASYDPIHNTGCQLNEVRHFQQLLRGPKSMQVSTSHHYTSEVTAAS